MNSWISFDGQHLNLAKASRINEIDENGRNGYRLYFGKRRISLNISKGDGSEEMRIAIEKIRFFLLDNQVPRPRLVASTSKSNGD
jgi:hypothetical protein